MKLKGGISFVFSHDGWHDAWQDLLRGASICVRTSMSLVGVATLVVGVCYASSTKLRTEISQAIPTKARLAFSRSMDIPSAPTIITRIVKVETPVLVPKDPSTPATISTPLITTSSKGSLDTPMNQVATYLAKRYHVADEAVRGILCSAVAAGKEQNVDPLLVVAVMAVESSLNPIAQSSVGAQGLMQVMTHVHSEKFKRRDQTGHALDLNTNIQIGTEILAQVIDQAGSVDGGLQLYLGSVNPTEASSTYIARVHSEMKRMQVAASGQITTALAMPAPMPRHHAAVVTESMPMNDLDTFISTKAMGDSSGDVIPVVSSDDEPS